MHIMTPSHRAPRRPQTAPQHNNNNKMMRWRRQWRFVLTLYYRLLIANAGS
jgi:hypothetical protein